MKEYDDQAGDLSMDSSTISIVYAYASGEDIDSMSKLALLKLYKADAPEDVRLTIPEFLGFVQEKLLPSKAFSTMADESRRRPSTRWPRRYKTARPSCAANTPPSWP